MSTFMWVKDMYSDTLDSHVISSKDLIPKNIESITGAMLHNSEIKKTSKAPLNLLVLDGGGARGASFNAYIEEIELMSIERGYGQNWLSRIDLVCGASIGGMAALTLNQTPSSTDNALQRSREIADLLVGESLGNISFWNLFCRKSASLLREDHQIRDIIAEKVFEGIVPPLKNEKGVKALAVCSMHKENDRGIFPFMLRTYELPHSRSQYACEGTCDLDLASAMQATASVPGVVDRIRIEHNGEQISLADGMFVGNTPVALAIKEAEALWPDREIGTVLSLGLDPSSQAAVAMYRAIDITRVFHPSLHFHRLIATNVMRDHSVFDFAKEKTDILEQKVKDFIRNDKRERLLIQKTLDLIYKNGGDRRLDPDNAEDLPVIKESIDTTLST
jgi:predicted acylesterase/phospholipase RssA